MSIADLSRGGLSLLRGQLNSPTFTWKNAEIPCVPSTLGTSPQVALGGFDVQVSFMLHVDTQEFFSVDTSAISIDGDIYTADDDRPKPVAGKLCGYRGKTYRIQSAKLSPCGSFIVLTLMDKNA